VVKNVCRSVSSFGRLILFVTYLARDISPGPIYNARRTRHTYNLFFRLTWHPLATRQPPAYFYQDIPSPQHMYNDTIYLFQMTCLFTAYLSWHTYKKAFCRLDSLILVMCPVYIQAGFFAGTLDVFLDAISSPRQGAVRYIPSALFVSPRLSVLL
jgi:hypothetical protein